MSLCPLLDAAKAAWHERGEAYVALPRGGPTRPSFWSSSPTRRTSALMRLSAPEGFVVSLWPDQTSPLADRSKTVVAVVSGGNVSLETLVSLQAER